MDVIITEIANELILLIAKWFIHQMTLDNFGVGTTFSDFGRANFNEVLQGFNHQITMKCIQHSEAPCYHQAPTETKFTTEKKTRETSKALNHAINQKKKAAAQELNIQMIHSDMVRFDFLILIPPVPQTRRLSSQPFVQVNKNMNIRLHPSLDCAEHVAFLLMMTVPIQIVYRRRMFIDFSISLLIIISPVRQWNGEPLVGGILQFQIKSTKHFCEGKFYIFCFD